MLYATKYKLRICITFKLLVKSETILNTALFSTLGMAWCICNNILQVFVASAMNYISDFLSNIINWFSSAKIVILQAVVTCCKFKNKDS